MDRDFIMEKISSGKIKKSDIRKYIAHCENELSKVGYSSKDISLLRESIDILIETPIRRYYEQWENDLLHTKRKV